ncbi:M15 family metallopeptidase [Microbacterium sp. W4I4]|uniref:M15 family metallopeptidase n=1 Tax=Microbacterium sp. W4I4 TaxID=3042295 RepID=UPI0027D92DFC|nr:M15 family metallopeptidase [Microbacterium sp. W4I4]
MSVAYSRHASRAPLAVRVALPVGVLFTAVACLATLGGVITEEAVVRELPAPMAALALPQIDVAATGAANPCADEAVLAALDAGDDSATIAAFGGGGEFREAVVAGNAPCVPLDDPTHVWVVVNKLRSLSRIDYAPSSVTASSLRPTSGSVSMHPEAAQALGRMADAARAAGAGTIGINNAYRSYHLQQSTYSSIVRADGAKDADARSARPGHSEHQTGFAADIVACSSGCGGIGAFGGTPQSDWVAEHAWEHGFIVRYEQGATGMTGYIPEPWHLRYIGVELAAAYNAGGFHTLEDFFELPAAADYAH